MKLLYAAPWLLALSACGGQESKTTEDAAFAEVLPGSASDAMLPYDTVTSAPPLEAPDTSPAASPPATDASPAPRSQSTPAGASDSEPMPEPEAS